MLGLVRAVSRQPSSAIRRMIALTTPLAPPCLTAELRQFQSVFQGVTGRWRWVAAPTNNVDLEPLCQSSLVGFGFAIHAEAHVRKALRGWDVEIVRHDAPISAVDAAMETGLASGQVTFDHLKTCQSAGGDSGSDGGSPGPRTVTR